MTRKQTGLRFDISKSARRIAGALGAALPALALLAGLGATAAQADRGANRLVSHYVTSDGSMGFVLDRSGARPMMQFTGSADVILLNPAPAARGDMIMRNPQGAVVLRVTSYGPATFYPEGNSKGIPLIRTPEGVQVAAGRHALDAGTMRSQARLVGEHVSMAVGKPVAFQADWEAVEADERSALGLSRSVQSVAEALRDLADKPKERKALAARLDTVTFMPGDGAGLRRQGRTLYVEYDRTKGEAGAPKPASIISFMRQASGD